MRCLWELPDDVLVCVPRRPKNLHCSSADPSNAVCPQKVYSYFNGQNLDEQKMNTTTPVRSACRQLVVMLRVLSVLGKYMAQMSSRLAPFVVWFRVGVDMPSPSIALGST